MCYTDMSLLNYSISLPSNTCRQQAVNDGVRFEK